MMDEAEMIAEMLRSMTLQERLESCFRIEWLTKNVKRKYPTEADEKESKRWAKTMAKMVLEAINEWKQDGEPE